MYSISITAQHTAPDQASSQLQQPAQHPVTASAHSPASGYSAAIPQLIHAGQDLLSLRLRSPHGIDSLYSINTT